MSSKRGGNNGIFWIQTIYLHIVEWTILSALNIKKLESYFDGGSPYRHNRIETIHVVSVLFGKVRGLKRALVVGELATTP